MQHERELRIFRGEIVYKTQRVIILQAAGMYCVLWRTQTPSHNLANDTACVCKCVRVRDGVAYRKAHATKKDEPLNFNNLSDNTIFYSLRDVIALPLSR